MGVNIPKHGIIVHQIKIITNDIFEREDNLVSMNSIKGTISLMVFMFKLILEYSTSYASSYAMQYMYALTVCWISNI